MDEMVKTQRRNSKHHQTPAKGSPTSKRTPRKQSEKMAVSGDFKGKWGLSNPRPTAGIASIQRRRKVWKSTAQIYKQDNTINGYGSP